MSKITNDGLTRSGTGCFIAVSIPYGNSGRQRVNLKTVDMGEKKYLHYIIACLFAGHRAN